MLRLRYIDNTRGMFNDNNLPWDLQELRSEPAFTSSKGNPLPRQIGAKNLAFVAGRHSICHSGREGGDSRLAIAGLGGTGHIGKKAARQ